MQRPSAAYHRGQIQLTGRKAPHWEQKLPARNSDRDFITALSRGLSVISAFSARSPEMTLSEVAAKTGLSPAAARRCLVTLSRLGYAIANGRRFLLRPKVLELGAAYLKSTDLHNAAQPALQELANRYGDSTSLAVLDPATLDVIYVAHVPGKRPNRVGVMVGYRLPAHATSLGQALLAHADEKDLESYLGRAPFRQYTSSTVTTASALRRRLSDVQKNGYAIVADQLVTGVIALSIPVLDHEGRAIAAVHCSSDSTRTTPEKLIESRLPALNATAHEIGLALRKSPALAHSLRRDQPDGENPQKRKRVTRSQRPADTRRR